MTDFTCMNPIVGVNNSTGQRVNLLLNNSEGKSFQATNMSAVGTSNPNGYAWKSVQIKSLVSSGGKVLALGSGVNSDNLAVSVAFSNETGDWQAMNSPLSDTTVSRLRHNSTVFSNGNYLSADGKIYVSTFKVNIPANGAFTTTKPSSTVVDTGYNLDGLAVSSSAIVASSLATAGTWTTTSAYSVAANWVHNVGEVVLISTNHKATSYTFPGYTATAPQIQRPSNKPLGDVPPGTGPDAYPWAMIQNTVTPPEIAVLYEGYYGVNSDATPALTDGDDRLNTTLATFTTTWSV